MCEREGTTVHEGLQRHTGLPDGERGVTASACFSNREENPARRGEKRGSTIVTALLQMREGNRVHFTSSAVQLVKSFSGIMNSFHLGHERRIFA